MAVVLWNGRLARSRSGGCRSRRLGLYCVGGVLSVENDMKVDDLFVETGSAKFLLNDHVLSVTSMEHRNGLGWRGETNKKKAKAYVDSICDKGTEGLGAIDWPRPGLMLMVR